MTIKPKKDLYSHSIYSFSIIEGLLVYVKQFLRGEASNAETRNLIGSLEFGVKQFARTTKRHIRSYLKGLLRGGITSYKLGLASWIANLHFSWKMCENQ